MLIGKENVVEEAKKKFIEELGDYIILDFKIMDDKNIFRICAGSKKAMCPYCKTISEKAHSKYIRYIDDIGFDGRPTALEVVTRKMFCKNPDCKHSTFAEEHLFVERNMKYTRRATGNGWGIKKSDNRKVLCKGGYPKWYLMKHPELVEPFKKPVPGDEDFVPVPLRYRD